MGDWKASCEIKLHLIGKEYKHDSYVNWPRREDVPDFIEEFFRDAISDANQRYETMIDEYHINEQQRYMAKEEQAERDELARLQAKYGDS